MLDQVQPRLVITTGTAGGLGPEIAAGDVLVSRHVRWNTAAALASQPWASQAYTSTARLRPGQFSFAAQHLLPAAAEHLPADRERRLLTGSSRHRTSVITTDFFAGAAERATLLPHLHSARAVDMADAALALVCTEQPLPTAWMSVRTACDAQTDVTEPDEGRREAASAYERLGYWATVSSAITCWSLAAPTRPTAPATKAR